MISVQLVETTTPALAGEGAGGSSGGAEGITVHLATASEEAARTALNVLSSGASILSERPTYTQGDR